MENTREISIHSSMFWLKWEKRLSITLIKVVKFLVLLHSSNREKSLKYMGDCDIIIVERIKKYLKKKYLN
jgi:hypothetical protein